MTPHLSHADDGLFWYKGAARAPAVREQAPHQQSSDAGSVSGNIHQAGSAGRRREGVLPRYLHSANGKNYNETQK